MEEKGIINGLPAAADEALFYRAVGKKHECRLNGAGAAVDGKSLGKRGLIPVPIEVLGRLWICGGQGEKIFSTDNGESICLEWAHTILREVVPIGKWTEGVEQNPEKRNDLEEYRGYAVLCPEQQAEYVLTGERMYLFRIGTPGSQDAVCESADNRRKRNGPPRLPDTTSLQIALL